MAKQTIFRTDPSSNQQYTIINNKLLQDSRISRETKGLICELMSRPTDWQITVRGIISSGTAGRDKVYKMIHEAVKYGYMFGEEEREKGKFSSQAYVVSDDPDFLQMKYQAIAEDVEKQYKKTASGKSGNGELPLPEKPYPAKPYPAKRTQQIKEDNKRKKITNYNPKNFSNSHQLPEYWMPHEKLRAWAREDPKVLATPKQIDEQSESFKDYHWSHGNKMKNWDLAFRTWMRNARRFKNLEKPNQPIGKYRG